MRRRDCYVCVIHFLCPWAVSITCLLSYHKIKSSFQNVGFAVDEPTLRFCNVGCAVCVFLVSPDLTKAICPCWGLLPCSFFRSFSSQSANSLRTESCFHQYLPCVSAVEQYDRTCSRASGLSHRLHLGSVVSSYRHRFAGDGSRS